MPFQSHKAELILTLTTMVMRNVHRMLGRINSLICYTMIVMVMQVTSKELKERDLKDLLTVIEVGAALLLGSHILAAREDA